MPPALLRKVRVANAREASAGRAVGAKEMGTVATVDVSVMVSVLIHVHLNHVVARPIYPSAI